MKNKYIKLTIGLCTVFGISVLIAAQPNQITQKDGVSIKPTPTPTKVAKRQKVGCSMPNTTAVSLSQQVQHPQSNDNGMTAKHAENMAKSSDWDCDGISDYDDNCRNKYNPKQIDRNRNRVGDACDTKKRLRKHSRKPRS